MKDTDFILGKDAIEAFTGQAFLLMAFHWKEAFDFPLKKIEGKPALSKKEFQQWLRAWDVDTIPRRKISTTVLEKTARKKRIAEMENKTITGINGIANFVNKLPYEIHDLYANYPSCPVKKINGQLSVGARDLVQWLEATQIRWGHYPGESTR